MKNKISKNKRLLNVLIVLLMISAMIPIIVTPVSAATRTSFTEYNGQNGKVWRYADASWNTAVTAATATLMSTDSGTVFNSPGQNNLQRGILFYDTSSIPDEATITAVSIRYPTLTAAYTSGYLYVNKANAGNSLDTADYSRAKFTELYCNYNWGGTTASFNITFNQNLSTSIDKTGITTFAIRFQKDYTNTAPSGDSGFDCADEHLITLWVDYVVGEHIPSIIDSVSPVNQSIYQPVSSGYNLSATVHDIHGADMNITFKTNVTGSWQTIGSNLSVGNGTYRQYCDTIGHDYSTTYWWKIFINNGYNWTNATYHFTTVPVTPITAGFSEYDGQNGKAVRVSDGSWNTAVTSTTAISMSIDTSTVYNSPTSFNCQRTFLFYDTSSIPDDATIVGVHIQYPTLTNAYPNGYIYVNKATIGSSLDVNDYNLTKYTDLYSKYMWGGSTAAFNMSFNQNVSTSINKIGLSTFVIRFAYDYLNSAPASESGFECSDEHLIKLWVNYTLIPESDSPIIDAVYPINGSTSCAVLSEYTLSATIHHKDGDIMNITFKTNSSGPWEVIGSNTSVGNGTYRQYCDTVGNGYNTKYWWRIILNDGTNWTNATYHFTTIFDSNTHAVYDGNYETNESSIVVTADGGFGVDNVSLYFKFSPDNTSGWYPSAPTGELLFDLADSHSITYPQRLWFDEENQRMFIAGYATSQLLIWDVEKQWDMHQLYSIAASNIHDVKAINNWSYGGREYGNIAMACVGSTTHNTLQTFRCNLSTAIASLDTYDIGVGGSVCPGYLDYFVNETGHLIVVQTKMTEPGNITIFDISNPTDIQVLKRFTTHNNEPWNPFFYDNGHHLMISFNDDNSLMNNTPELYDVTNLRNPVYVGPLYDLGIGMTQVLTCWSSTNPNLAYGARAYYDVGHPSTRYCKLVSYDCSDAENWIELSNVDITSNGEWQLDYTTNDWAAVRGYIYGETRHQVDFYYVGNPYNMTPAGTYTNVDIITSPHMQWLDMTHSRGFFLDYSKDTFFSLNITLNQTDSWELFETDESEPWLWNFDFPNGTGYYCLMTRSSTDGELESIPLTADEFVFYNPDYVHPMNNLPVVNESMPRIENTSIHMIWKYAAVDVDDLMTLMGNFTNMTVTKYNYITHVWNEVTTVNLNDLINITVNYSELPFKDTFITIIPQIRVFVYDGDGDVVNVSLYTNSTGNWTLVDYHTITPVGFITSGWINFYDYDMDEYNTTYYYRIVTNDTTDEITTNFSFTTGIESIIIPPVTGDDYMMYTIGIVVLIALVAMLYLLLKRKR